MICQEKKVLYIHIPKCGGTYIEANFTPGVDWHARGEKHFTLTTAVSRYGEETVRPCYRFATVRNPFRRLASQFLYYRAKNIRPFRMVEAAESRGSFWRRALRKFDGGSSTAVMETAPISDEAYRVEFFESFQTFVGSLEAQRELEPWAVNGLQPATDFVRGAGGVDIDEVFLLEEIEQWLPKLGGRFGIRFSQEPINTASERYSWEELYTPREIEFVKRVYAKDLQQFYPQWAEYRGKTARD